MSVELFSHDEPVLVVVGPTAIGKTALSLAIAERYNCEIISLDSMQVYRYMDIGTAKASLQERQQIPHHLIDVVEPDEHYDANRFVSDALSALQKIKSRGKISLITGGTGLYLRALTEGLFEGEAHHPELREQLRQRFDREGCSKLHEELMLIDRNSAIKIHKNDKHRLLRALEIYYATGKNWSEHLELQSKNRKPSRFTKILKIGLTCDRETLYQRINKRTSYMLQSGLKEETLALLKRGYGRDLKPMQAIGYRHMIGHLYDNWSMDETERLLARDTRRYAKRQYTWFKKMDIDWIEVSRENEIFSKITSFLS